MPALMSHVLYYDLKKPENRQFNHIRQAWGQPGLVTSDDLRRVKVSKGSSKSQSQRIHVVIFWPKFCMMSHSCQWEQVKTLKIQFC